MFSGKELAVLNAVAKAAQWNISEVSRNSAKPFDIAVKGQYLPDAKYLANMEFGANLKLAAIRVLVQWTSPAVAKMSNYPAMARQGDWSGIRDSEDANIDAIFEKFVLVAI